MKKNIVFCYMLIVLFYFVFSTYSNKNLVYAETEYAQIINATNIYKSNTINLENNCLCLAEKSYFVEIIRNENELYKINYNGITGFVKKNDVKVITNKPCTPYPNNIKITIASNCNLRSTPTTQSFNNNIISVIYKDESNLEFIGRIFSEEAIDFGGTEWYYVKYENEYGYIYNQYVKSITPIYENTEMVIYKSPSIDKIQNPLTSTPSIIIMIILFIPSLAILLILYLPRKSAKPKLKKAPKVIDKY